MDIAMRKGIDRVDQAPDRVRKEGTMWFFEGRMATVSALAALLLLASACAGKEEASRRAQKKAAPTEQAQSADGPAPLPDQLPCQPEGTALQITALKAEAGKLAAYDKGCLAAPAGEDFTITLTSDDFLEHNVSIYLKDGASYSDGLFHGELFRGPGESRTYDVPAISDPGIYAFRCDEHLSTMKGVFVVA
jgi:plastocyanin